MDFAKKIIIFVFILFFGFCVQADAESVSLYFIPQSQDIYQNDTFLVRLDIDTSSQGINALEVEINFSKDLLEVINLKEETSAFTLWPDKPIFSNENGKIFFSAGSPKGFQGKASVLTITFFAKKKGSGQVNINQVSQILLNDGKATRARTNFNEADFEIFLKPSSLPNISSNTHPDSLKWYSQKNLRLVWELKSGAEYSYLLSQDPLAEPDEIPDRPEGELEWIGALQYDDLADGVYYFSLKEKINNKWSSVIRYRAMVDTIPPADFKALVTEIENKNYAVFNAIDGKSGIDFYEVLESKLKNQGWQIGESPYSLQDQSLRSFVKIKAVDRAGNERIAEILPIAWKPNKATIIIIIILGLIISSWFIFKKNRRKAKRK